ncbi:MAG: hypothetical protein ACI8PZ_002785 [Myxococcota bacterium]|jgi:hypothetical protein
MLRNSPSRIALTFRGVTLALWVLCGCTPLHGGWRIPQPAAGTTAHWVLALAGTPIGHEQQRQSDGLFWSRRAWNFAVDGVVVSPTIEVRARLRTDGSVDLVERADATGRDAWRPLTPAWLAETAPARTGTTPVLDPGTGEVELLAVTVTGPLRRVGPREWSEDGGWRIGALTASPVPRAPSLPSADLLSLVRIPSTPVPQAQRSRHAAITIDDTTHRIDVPVRAEIPAELWRRVERLVRRVQAQLDTTPTPGQLSAGAALAAGAGDCTEHREVFLELAIADGIDARPAEGLVYVDGPEPGFLPHAWAEVRVGDRWVGVDPTWSQWPADATHVPLGEQDRLDVITRAGTRRAVVTDVR